MRTMILIAALGAALAACGGGSSDKSTETAGDAVKRQFAFISDGQFGREWDELHPADQAVVSRDHFERCGAGKSVNIDSVTVKETYDDTITVAGADTASKAVTVELKSGSAKDTRTFHEVMVDGKWRWVIADTSSYSNGKCP